MSFVLDASAVLAVLLDEPGGDFVFDAMNGSHISIVNLSEVYATLMDAGMTFETVQQVVEPLPMRRITFREDHAWQTAKLRSLTKKFGLSLGDRACITTAIFESLPILTADRRMAEAKAVLDLDIRMIR
jgi:ribonuclease VapC